MRRRSIAVNVPESSSFSRSAGSEGRANKPSHLYICGEALSMVPVHPVLEPWASRIQTLGWDTQVAPLKHLYTAGLPWAESTQGPAHAPSGSGHADGMKLLAALYNGSPVGHWTSTHMALAPHSHGSPTYLSPASLGKPFQAREAHIHCILVASRVTLSKILRTY